MRSRSECEVNRWPGSIPLHGLVFVDVVVKSYSSSSDALFAHFIVGFATLYQIPYVLPLRISFMITKQVTFAQESIILQSAQLLPSFSRKKILETFSKFLGHHLIPQRNSFFQLKQPNPTVKTAKSESKLCG